MKDYRNHIEFDIADQNELVEKIKRYFDFYGFDLIDDTQFVFVKKWSFWEGWRFNPLDWESRLEININDRSLNIDHLVSSNGILTPVGFAKFYQSFLLNFEKFINHSKEFTEPNKREINNAKLKVYKYHALLVLGVVLGFFIGNVLGSSAGFKWIGYATMIITVLIMKKVLNYYLLNYKDYEIQQT